MTDDNATPDPEHSVPQVSFGSDAPAPDVTEQDESARELQKENAATSMDQPSS